MKTYSPKKKELEKKWYIVDAKGKTLGRMSTEIAKVLRGKQKPLFAPHVDCGDFVIVINAKDIKVTGDKLNSKFYYRHSGYPGALKKKPLKDLLDEKPAEVVKKAVAGMIPGNKLKKEVLMKLKIYEGEEHPHEAQKPEPLTI
jgi:large subunit ribosomal protein L13